MRQPQHCLIGTMRMSAYRAVYGCVTLQSRTMSGPGCPAGLLKVRWALAECFSDSRDQWRTLAKTLAKTYEVHVENAALTTLPVPAPVTAGVGILVACRGI